MQIIQLTIENIKKLKAIRITPNSNIVKITGKNEQGKTTVIDCIWWALGGAKDIQSQPIRTGQKKGKIELIIGNCFEGEIIGEGYIVTRDFTKEDDSIVFDSSLKIESTGKRRSVFKSPQALLDSLINKRTIDPWWFANLGNTADGRKKQVEILLDIANLKPDLVKLEEISGFKPRGANPDLIAAINEVYQFVYEERTAVNRDLEKAKAKLESLPKGITEIKPVITMELIAEKERLEKINLENTKKREITSLQQRKVDALKSDIEDLESQLKELRLKLETEQTTFSNLTTKISQLQDEDLTEITQKIVTADETNKKARQWEEQAKVIADVFEFQQESEHLTEKLGTIKDYKTNIIKNANFPIPGLDFANGGVLYEGLPYEQASTTKRLQVSLDIGMALDPTLRVIRIDGGNDIDSEHMAVIEKKAEEKGFQIWMTLTDESGQVGVCIEDGEIKNG